MSTYNRYGSCPKCGSWALTSDYKKGAHTNCPTSQASERLINFSDHMRFFWAVPISKAQAEEEKQVGDKLQADFDAVEEHIERNCNNCGFKWDEGVLG